MFLEYLATLKNELLFEPFLSVKLGSEAIFPTGMKLHESCTDFVGLTGCSLTMRQKREWESLRNFPRNVVPFLFCFVLNFCIKIKIIDFMPP